MQNTLLHLLAFLLTSDRAGGIWFAAGGLGALAVAMRVVREVPDVPLSHWLKVGGLAAMALGILAIALERLWYPVNSSGHSNLPQHSTAATVLLIGVCLLLLGGVLLLIQGVQHGVARSREQRPLKYMTRRQSE